MAERSVTIRILGDATKAQKAFADAGTSATTFEGKIEGAGGKFAGFGSVVSGVLAAGAVQQFGGILKDGAQGAAEDTASLLRLQQAVKNTGSSYDDYGGAVDEAIKRGQSLAFTDGETSDALAKLISLTGSTEEGMNRLTVAQDLARGAGISLDQAALLLGKTSDENTAALGRMGIQLDKNATAQDVLNTVDAKFGGQAGVYAASDAGKFAIAQQNIGEMAETLGTALIPAISLAALVMTTLLQAVTPLIQYIGSSPPILAGLAAVLLTAVVPALIAKTTALYASVTAWLAANAAMLPIIAVAAAIGVAIGLLYVAWQSNFLGIQDITQQVIDVVRPYIETAIAAIQTAIETTLGAIQTAWDTVWPYLQTAIEIVWLAISTYVSTYILVVQTVIETALGIIQTVWDTVFPYIQTVVETVFPVIQTVVSTYIGIVQTVIETALGVVKGIWDTVVPALQAVAETVFPAIASVVSSQIEIARAAIDTGVNAMKWVFENVFVPIQGIVSDVFNTISGVVTTVWDPTVTAIGLGVDTVKLLFDGLVSIQGIVSDVFSTISGLVSSLWNNGAVLSIASGIGTIKSVFSGIYATMYGFGSDIVQGLIDGVAALFNTLKGWFDKITGLLTIDVPGFSPPYEAGREQGRSFISGLTDGVTSGFGAYRSALASVSSAMGGVSAREAPVAATGSTGSSGATGGPGGSGNKSQGMLALERGATFLGCSMELIGQDNGTGLFQFPDGRKQWLDASFCKGGRTGPSETQLRHAGSVAGGSASAPQGSRLVAQTRTPAGAVTISDEAMERLARTIARVLRGALMEVM